MSIDRFYQASSTKLLLLFGIALCLILGSGCSGDSDKIVSPSYSVWLAQSCDTAFTLNAVHFVDARNGWMVGYDAAGTRNVLFNSADGGKSWQILHTFANIYLTDVFFPDAERGWLIGFDYSLGQSTLLYTSDGGNNLAPQLSNLGPWWLAKIHFTDQNNGWVIAENGVIRTTDGGRTWNVFSSKMNLELRDAHFIDHLKGWAVGKSGAIFRTENGGETWAALVPLNKYQDLNAVFFIDAKVGWAIGADILLTTVNGGNTWTSRAIENFSGFHFLHFIDEKNGWILGDHGIILKTANSGANWKVQDSGTTESLLSGCFLSNQAGWAVGRRGTVLRLMVIKG